MSIICGEHSYVDGDHEEFFDPKVTIGKFTSIANGVIFCGRMNHEWIAHKESVTTFNFRERWKDVQLDFFNGVGHTRGPITIGNDVWIGRDAFIMDGVTIGDGAIIGARAMVNKDVPPYAIWVGNPGRVAKYRFTQRDIEALSRIKWWEWDKETIIERMEYFKDINKLIEKYDI